jgi:hypothetical protein
MQTIPQSFRGWLQIYFTAVEVAVVGLTCIIQFCFPHGTPSHIWIAWCAATILLVISTAAYCFFDRSIAASGVVVLTFVAVFYFGWH